MLHPSNHLLDQRRPSQPFTTNFNKSLRPMSAAQQTTMQSSGHFRVTVDMDQQQMNKKCGSISLASETGKSGFQQFRDIY